MSWRDDLARKILAESKVKVITSSHVRAFAAELGMSDRKPITFLSEQTKAPYSSATLISVSKGVFFVGTPDIRNALTQGYAPVAYALPLLHPAAVVSMESAFFKTPHAALPGHGDMAVTALHATPGSAAGGRSGIFGTRCGDVKLHFALERNLTSAAQGGILNRYPRDAIYSNNPYYRETTPEYALAVMAYLDKDGRSPFTMPEILAEDLLHVDAELAGDIADHFNVREHLSNIIAASSDIEHIRNTANDSEQRGPEQGLSGESDQPQAESQGNGATTDSPGPNTLDILNDTSEPGR